MLWVKTHTDVSLTHFGEMLSKNKYKHFNAKTFFSSTYLCMPVQLCEDIRTATFFYHVI